MAKRILIEDVLGEVSRAEGEEVSTSTLTKLSKDYYDALKDYTDVSKGLKLSINNVVFTLVSEETQAYQFSFNDMTENYISIWGIYPNVYGDSREYFIYSYEDVSYISSEGCLGERTTEYPWTFQEGDIVQFYVEEEEQEQEFLDKIGFTHFWNNLKTYITNLINTSISTKQDTLVSGTNIKTINSQSILGSGNIDIQGGRGGIEEFVVTFNPTNFTVITPFAEIEDAVTSQKKIWVQFTTAPRPYFEIVYSTISNSVIYLCTATGSNLTTSNQLFDFEVFTITNDMKYTEKHLMPVLRNNIDTTMSDTSYNVVANRTIKQYIDNREPSIVVEGNWHYRIYNDGSFEAWYGETGVTFVINSQSGNLSRSDLQTLTLPTGLTNQGTTEIISFDVGVGHNNYPVFSTIANMSNTEIKYYVMSGSTRNSSPNYKLSAYVYGLITLNQ